MAKNPDKNYSKLGRKKNCISFFLRSSQAGVFYFLSNCSNLSSWTWSCAPGFSFQLFFCFSFSSERRSRRKAARSRRLRPRARRGRRTRVRRREKSPPTTTTKNSTTDSTKISSVRNFFHPDANRTCCWTAFSEIKLRWSLSEISNIWGYFLVLSHCGPMLSQLSCHSSQLIGITLDRGQMAERTKTYLC